MQVLKHLALHLVEVENGYLTGEFLRLPQAGKIAQRSD